MDEIIIAFLFTFSNVHFRGKLIRSMVKQSHQIIYLGFVKLFEEVIVYSIKNKKKVKYVLQWKSGKGFLLLRFMRIERILSIIFWFKEYCHAKRAKSNGYRMCWIYWISYY